MFFYVFIYPLLQGSSYYGEYMLQEPDSGAAVSEWAGSIWPTLCPLLLFTTTCTIANLNTNIFFYIPVDRPGFTFLRALWTDGPKSQPYEGFEFEIKSRGLDFWLGRGYSLKNRSGVLE